MRIYPAVLLAALFMVCGSCDEKEPHGPVQGSVEVSITTGELHTKAPSGDPADGGGIIVDGTGKPDLAIAIANSGGSLVAWYPDDFFGAMSTDYSSECNTSLTDATTSTVFFTGLVRANGPYTVYAVANTAGLPATSLSSLKACTTVSQMDDLQLSVASGQPTFEDGSHNECMPITAKGTLTVLASGNGQVDLQLQRPVARISVTFKNETGDADLEVHACNVVIGDINPSCGYLFQRSPDEVTGYGRNIEMDAPVISGDDKLIFDAQNKSTLDTVQVFPSVAPARQVGSRYLCTISFRITKNGQTYNAGDATTYDEYTFPDLPIHDSRSSDILYLGRNQHLKIETRITKQASLHDYSFNFEVQDWDSKENYMTFD